MDPTFAYAESLDAIDDQKKTILNLSTIAWESSAHAVQIRDLINRKIIAETSPRKIKALVYLIDAIIKNPRPYGDKTFLNVFAQNVASIFANAYRKVVNTPNVNSLNNVKNTWSTIFPQNVLDNLERNVKAELDQGRATVHIYDGAQAQTRSGQPPRASNGEGVGGGPSRPQRDSHMQRGNHVVPPSGGNDYGHPGQPQHNLAPYGQGGMHSQQGPPRGPSAWEMDQRAEREVRALLLKARQGPDSQVVEAFTAVLDLIDKHKQCATINPALAVRLTQEVNGVLLERLDTIRVGNRTMPPPPQYQMHDPGYSRQQHPYNNGTSMPNHRDANVHNKFNHNSMSNMGRRSFEQAVRQISIPKGLENDEDAVNIHSEENMNRFRESIAGLYEGKQCPMCGMRFDEADKEGYSKHMDWHYEQNHLKGVLKLTSRRWFPKPENWISPGSVAEKEEVDADPVADAPDPVVEELCFVSTDGDEDGVCSVSGESLTRLFEPDLGQWYYEDAVRVDGKLIKKSIASKDASKKRSGDGVNMDSKRIKS